MSIFEQASRIKLRFASNKGQLACEDLWDLSLESLDSLAKAANRAVKDSEEESFIKTRTNKDIENSLRLAILKRVIEVKMAEAEAKKTASEKRAHLQTLKQIRDAKALEQLGTMELADLDKMIAEQEASL